MRPDARRSRHQAVLITGAVLLSAGVSVGVAAGPSPSADTIEPASADSESARAHAYLLGLKHRDGFRHRLERFRPEPGGTKVPSIDRSPFVSRRLSFDGPTGHRRTLLLTYPLGTDFSKGAATLVILQDDARDFAFSREGFPWLDFGGAYASISSEDGVLAAADLVAAGELLVAQKLTSPAKLGILAEGRDSALAMEAANAHPDVFSTLLLQRPFPFEWPVGGGSTQATLVLADERARVAAIPASPYTTAGEVPAPLRLVRMERQGVNSIEEAADLWAFAAQHTHLSDPGSRTKGVARPADGRGRRP